MLVVLEQLSIPSPAITPRYHKSMREIAIIMKKGGVAKTTTTVSVASWAASLGLDVGVIDLDSQASATRALGLEPSDDVAEVLLGERPLADAWTSTPYGVRVVRSNPSTESAERQLAADAIDGLTALRRAIEASGSDRPDVILMDTRPDEAHGTLNALVAASEVWIAAEPVPASIEVFPRLMSTVERLGGALNPGLRVTAIIPTRFDARTQLHKGGLEALRQRFGKLVTQHVPMSVKVSEAHGAHVPLDRYAPTSPASVAYRAITEQLLCAREVAA